LAPGIYAETIDVYHGRQVAIHGPLSGDSSCPDANVVKVSQRSVQDNATVWVNCLITGTVHCRQWAIADGADVAFDGTSASALVANATCRINTAGTLRLDGHVAGFAIAQNYSTIYVAGEIVVSQPNLELAYFLRAIESTLDLSGAVLSGHPLASGLRFMLDHGVIVFPAAGAGSIPGNGSEATNFFVCRPC
jgi:hypothetical protein